MENDEKICFCYYKQLYDSININIVKQSKLKDRPNNYNVTPSWMKTRLCLFWMFWIALLLALVTSILMYCCFLLPTCPNSIKNIKRNVTSFLNI
ncbi:odorant receptor 2a-like isoform X1 [Vespula maculifrons]|uniref:Odorant receptor 2a-like isoform X1 n=1 Tax=Vespula maculifrons TaxID=7453 RepID=A0ABD2AVU3_VESMC